MCKIKRVNTSALKKQNERETFMRITALGKPFYNYPKNNVSANKVSISALRPASADIFCFKGGNSLDDKIGIIPSSTPTPLEKKIESNLGVTPTKTIVKRLLLLFRIIFYVV